MMLVESFQLIEGIEIPQLKIQANSNQTCVFDPLDIV